VELINAAERPLILAGHGIMLSGAESRVLALAERGRIPIAVTLLGIGGVPASHPLNLGMMGMHGEAWVNQAIQEADLLIALGMRFDDRVTGNLKTYAKNAKKIHVDVDRAELNKHVRPRSLITSGGLGTMGFALPAAIGAKIARPDAEVWVVAGDGGFQMTMPELATIVQEGLDINIAIINNGYLGMVRQWQEFF